MLKYQQTQLNPKTFQMAKIKTEDLLSKISELPIPEQVELLSVIKKTVSANIEKSMETLKEQSKNLQSTLEKING